MRFARALLLVALAAACTASRSPTPVYGHKIVNVYPHDPKAFTQGLVYQDGFLYEGTGLNGSSTIRKVDLKSGKTLQQASLPAEYFGEGITLWKDKLVQLTWHSKIGFVYDRATFRLLRTFVYQTEGWGLTNDGKRLIMSDGSSNLYFLDPETFRETGKLEVRDQGRVISNLNELEYVRGEIYANIWQTNRVARISPTSGQVLAWIDLEGLRRQLDPAMPIDVLNGIAYDARLGRLFVTGKNWPKLFEISVISKKSGAEDARPLDRSE